MNFSEWFRGNTEQLKALSLFCRKGEWPKDFIPENVHIDNEEIQKVLIRYAILRIEEELIGPCAWDYCDM